MRGVLAAPKQLGRCSNESTSTDEFRYRLHASERGMKRIVFVPPWVRDLWCKCAYTNTTISDDRESLTHCEPLEALAAGTANREGLPSRLVCARSDGWAGADHDARTSRYCLCAGFGRSRNLWAVCHDRTLARVRALWSQPHPGAGAGFVSRPCDSCRRVPSLRWRCHACGSPREHDGGGVGSGVHPYRYVAAGVRYGAYFQAHSLRLHEWHRAYRADQPAAEALRLLDRWHRSIARPRAHRPRHSRRTNELDVVRSRRQHTRCDPSAQALQADPWPFARGRRRDYRGGYAEPRR